ncbi:hypothetical protein NTJ56_28615 [Burkholderia contaminans]|nr:hypothetical protein [Burkholderia contaminans]MCA7913514.1 hypothetical protein [Burkholderia contaminans]UUX39662.1 hypothetical protein NTJ56_28615 [Burkholderia contaminans]
MTIRTDRAALARGACTGPYEGMTDEMGRGVMYRCNAQSKIDVSFH